MTQSTLSDLNVELELRNLRHYYQGHLGMVPAVDGIDLTLKKGEIIGIVGESGCGKSTVVKSLLGLLPSHSSKRVSGEAWFDGQDIFQCSRRELRAIRGNRIAMIFQDPRSALDPVYTVGDQIMEAILIHKKVSRQEARNKALELLRKVHIPSPEIRIDQYPHELSGGMQQRVMIAIALSCEPSILIADEPTTALDVTIQAQILRLILDLKDELDLSVIIITHNMGVVASICDRMMVMYGGVVVEEGSCLDLFEAPLHPYTQGLLQAIPSASKDIDILYSIPGQVPRFTVPVQKCRFIDRCPYARSECSEKEPDLRDIGSRKVRCILELSFLESISLNKESQENE